MKPTEYSRVTTLSDDDLVLTSTSGNVIQTIKKDDLKKDMGGGESSNDFNNGVYIYEKIASEEKNYEMLNFMNTDKYANATMRSMGLFKSKIWKLHPFIEGLEIRDRHLRIDGQHVVAEKILYEGLTSMFPITFELQAGTFYSWYDGSGYYYDNGFGLLHMCLEARSEQNSSNYLDVVIPIYGDANLYIDSSGLVSSRIDGSAVGISFDYIHSDEDKNPPTITISKGTNQRNVYLTYIAIQNYMIFEQ